MNIINPKPLKIKSIRLNFNFDTDKDGVPDWKDCRPFDSRRHSIKPSKTMKRRIERLPLYVSHVQPEHLLYQENIPKYKLLSKEAKTFAPKEQQRMLSTIKKYPSVIGEMERQKPSSLTYTEKPFMESSIYGATLPEEKGVVISKVESEFMPKRQYGLLADVIYQEAPKIKQEREKEFRKERPYLEEPREVQSQKQRRLLAKGMFHELTHIKQASTMTPEEIYAQADEEEYEERPIEKEAYAVAKQKLLEREKKERPPTGKEISKTLMLDEESDSYEKTEE